MQQSDRYLIRDAKPEEQRELTRLCVRATLHSGYDDVRIECGSAGKLEQHLKMGIDAGTAKTLGNLVAYVSAMQQ